MATLRDVIGGTNGAGEMAASLLFNTQTDPIRHFKWPVGEDNHRKGAYSSHFILTAPNIRSVGIK
ncbi:MAG: hypothetical protein A2201_03500 [Alicyclobacillus sp. RIFOXYA1_FULL_53_8]|nr:MAG: hypothetical protein A2201_03500 [Alicyclobacillus sp. RIFOXYA1_FULL_53_8]